MKYYAQFHGGYNYALPDHDDYEEFGTMKAAIEAFRKRVCGEDSRFPACDSTASMLVWDYDPRGSGDPYPTFRLSVGPRGGIVKRWC